MMKWDTGIDAERKRRQTAAEMHRLHMRLRWSACRTIRAKAMFLLRLTLQPVVALAHAAKGTRTYGPNVARITGVSLMRQFLHQWAIGARFGIDWDAYYRYRLYRLPNAQSALLFLPLEANIALRAHLYRKIGVDKSRLADKRRFYRTCLENDLPVPPTIAEFENGEVLWWLGHTELPKRDLFSKPANNIKGIGAARWIWQGEDRYRDEDAVIVTGSELITHLQERSRSVPYILQVRLTNHPLIARIAPDTLCTIRVVTHRGVGGEPEHLASTFRMAGGSFPADNFSQRGLASRVDQSTGELWPAVFKELHDTAVEHTNHPVFGAPIAGFRLPDWEKVIELGLRAHRMFYDFPSVGWDVAVTPEGPVLIEGNYNWNVVLTQQAGGPALGETPFFESYLSYLK